MLKLRTSSIQSLSDISLSEPFIARISTNFDYPEPLRTKEIFLLKGTTQKDIPKGFKAYFLIQYDENILIDVKEPNTFLLQSDQYYLDNQDIVRFDPIRKTLRVIYRKNSNQNSLLLTERCNNHCVMCSQPPRDIDDNYLVNELLTAIPMMSRQTKEIGFTGGEPTILGDNFINLIRACKNFLPETSLHILSNGRNFKNLELAQKVADIRHHDLIIGIPLYSDISNIHNYVVQADNAFDETIRGILNLKQMGVRVEIRIVIHKQTYLRLAQLAEFISRNLLFVDHVALMGLEMMGFTKANIDDLWIDPVDYQPQLVEAVKILNRFKMNVSVYNHQLCLLDKKIWDFNRKSISDWKNEYMPECEPCTKKNECGGFFASAKFKYSKNIQPFIEGPVKEI